MDYNAPNTRERIAARRQSRRTTHAHAGGSLVQPGLRRRLLGWLATGQLVGAALFLVACTALVWLLSDRGFSIRQVTVEGNSALSTAEVIDQADLRGRPIWFVDHTRAEANLQANSYIESVQVQIALPDRATIRLVERRPEVRWLAGGVQYLVDGRGQVIAAAQEPAETDVLVIVDNSHPELKPNDQIDIDALTLARTLALRLPNDLGFTPTQIGWDIGLGVYVRSAANQTIVFGQSEHLERKLAALDFLLKDKTAFTYLDLRPSNPFYQN
jgi:cell division protein FtsQ